jgi:hypothetical protein
MAGQMNFSKGRNQEKDAAGNPEECWKCSGMHLNINQIEREILNVNVH